MTHPRHPPGRRPPPGSGRIPPGMVRIEVDDETLKRVRFAAQVFGVSESEIVTRAVNALSEQAAAEPSGRDQWEPVEIYGDYEGRRVSGKFLPATKRLTIVGEPLDGEVFTSPSAAARAVVAALNPDRTAAQTNGWRFWRIAATGERLEVLR